MAELATSVEAIDFLIDGARYGDLEDVHIALEEYKVAVDAVDSQSRSALHMASANGHLEICKVLLERGAIVRLLMDHGASASAVNSQGRTPVDEALGKPHQDSLLGIVNSFGKTTDRLDADDDPESGDYEMEEQNGAGRDPDLKPYDKYGDPDLKPYDKYG